MAYVKILHWHLPGRNKKSQWNLIQCNYYSVRTGNLLYTSLECCHYINMLRWGNEWLYSSFEGIMVVMLQVKVFWGNSVSTVTRLQTGWPGSISKRVRNLFLSTTIPHQFWSLLSLLSNGYRWIFARRCKVTEAWNWLLTSIYCQG